MGRPSDYDAERIGREIKHYLDLCKANSYLPTVEGLAVHLSVARSTICEGRKDHPEFSDILEQRLALQTSMLIQNGLKSEYNPTITKLMLKLWYEQRITESRKVSCVGRTMYSPGPNNPVGLIWIGLNGEGYGIHGTPDPSKISKTQSNGCVRLNNWDAVQFGAAVEKGHPGRICRWKQPERGAAAEPGLISGLSAAKLISSGLLRESRTVATRIIGGAPTAAHRGDSQDRQSYSRPLD